MREYLRFASASTGEHNGQRIVFTTLGSLGDLYPYLALGLGMQARGYQAVIATSPCYQRQVESVGLLFRPLRPDSDWVTDPERMGHYMHPRWGTIRVLREQILPMLRQSYEDTLAASDQADLLVCHPIAFATRLVAERRGLRWVSSLPFPLGLFSAHDPPLLPGVPELSQALRFLGPAFWKPLGQLLKRATRSWAAPWYELRREIGLPDAPNHNPLVDGYSADLHLALFSKLLADRQPDWPTQTVLTGFPFYDRDNESGLPPLLERFLNAGPSPVVFTLGWSAATVAGSFFSCSVIAAQRLGCRAVFVGRQPGIVSDLPSGMIALDYAPFAELFLRAAAVVHPGGVGTTALAMRAGCPALIVPFAQDQLDNAARAARRGFARALNRSDYTPVRVAAELDRLLRDSTYRERAYVVQEQIQQEDGVRVACDALEALLRKGGSGNAHGR
jgi:UDP:flavonoid glycosyltransferase YjiC (YdhE family)